MVSDDGLTNGADGPSMAMEVDVGLINGLPNDGGRSRAGPRPLLGRLKIKRRAAREALERTARGRRMRPKAYNLILWIFSSMVPSALESILAR